MSWRERGGDLCWRHHLRLFGAAYGSLLDLTGRAYVRWAREILESARGCARCAEVQRRKYGWNA